MDHPKPNLKIVEANQYQSGEKFDGAPVTTAGGEELGHVQGFVVDIHSGDARYIVVDAGGWFRSKEFLLPIGHARLDSEREVLVADLTRDRVDRFPGFDKDEFHRLSEEDLDRFGATTAAACCDSEVLVAGQPWYERSHYQQPEWWQNGYYRPERMVAQGSGPDTSQRDVDERRRDADKGSRS